MKVQKKYKTFVKRLKMACKQLRWKLSFDTNIIELYEIEDGIGFTIDGVAYYVGKTIRHSIVTEFVLYYASVIVQNHGNREEPPSEDEQILEGENVSRPEDLVMRLIDNHWKERRNWVGESLLDMEQQESDL